jgi:hypothetical protein
MALYISSVVLTTSVTGGVSGVVVSTSLVGGSPAGAQPESDNNSMATMTIKVVVLNGLLFKFAFIGFSSAILIGLSG